MIFTRAEIDILRLTAWCKDLPIGNAKIIPANIVKLLLELGLIRKSRCELSYRITTKGCELLQKAGFYYEADKHYRGKGSVLTRRLETANITSFLWRSGADVFLNSPNTKNNELSFLPSFALRRKTYANVLGGTRLAGFLYSGDIAFIPYYVSIDSEGIYANVEYRTFRAESLLNKRSPCVIYTGLGSFDDVISATLAKRNKKDKSTTDTYIEAMEKFRCPCTIIPMNEAGIRQLRILSVENYKETLLKQVLGRDYHPPIYQWSDGYSIQSKENFLIGIDCNIIRFTNAIKHANTKIHIIILSTQAEAIKNHLIGQNTVLHPIDEEIAERILGISHELPPLDLSPFQTEKGEYLYASAFRDNKKGRRQSRIILEEA